MNKHLVLNLIILSFFLSCQKPINQENKLRHTEAQKLISFFNEKAYNEELGTYYSEISNEGKVLSEKVFNVALSRLIYGLSYASNLDSSYLEKAQKAAQFQLDHLISNDSLTSHFVSFYDLKNKLQDSSEVFDIWQQAYGLCGLSELYRHTNDEALLSKIHQYHESFIQRFHDDKNGGFYSLYENNTQVSGSKTLQALIYPVTSYMENLWSIDVSNQDKYEQYLKENIQLAYDNGWNQKLGWVNIKFDDNWKPCPHASKDSTCFNVSPGHNFQFASVFLRAKNWSFLSGEERNRYYNFGLEVLKTTLEKPIYPEQDLSQGFYSEVNPVTSEVIDNRKTWWQTCEAILTLALAGNIFDIQRENLEQFFFNTFPDKVNGGEFFYVDENNLPQSEEMKGSIGKSAYHTIEMIKFLEERNY